MAPISEHSKILSILLIDNQVLFREGLISMLKNEQDIEVVGEAGTVKEGLEKALVLKPQLALLEINLPDGDGIKLTKDILCHLPQTNIVMLTTCDSFDIMVTALLAGAKGYLAKSTPITHVLASLRAVVRGELALPRICIPPILEELIRLERAISSHTIDERSITSCLTSREIEVLNLLAQNASNQDIAKLLFITENTVKVHVSRILEKLNFNSRGEAGEFAQRYNLGTLSNESKQDNIHLKSWYP